MPEFSFAGCGFMCIYYPGVCAAIKKFAPGLITSCRIYGASAGAIAAAGLICDIPPEDAVANVMKIIHDARGRRLRAFNPGFNIMALVREGLNKHLPENAHKLCSGKLFISLTRYSDGKNITVSQFSSKDDLIDAIVCSSFIPYFAGLRVPTFRGQKFMDGGFSNNQPFSDSFSITIAPFSGETDICPPDLLSANTLGFVYYGTSMRFTLENVERFYHTLIPPSDELCGRICRDGFSDTVSFLCNNGISPCVNCLERLQGQDIAAIIADRVANFRRYSVTSPIEACFMCNRRLPRFQDASSLFPPELDRALRAYEKPKSTLDACVDYVYSFRLVRLWMFFATPVIAPIKISFYVMGLFKDFVSHINPANTYVAFQFTIDLIIRLIDKFGSDYRLLSLLSTVLRAIPFCDQEDISFEEWEEVEQKAIDVIERASSISGYNRVPSMCGYGKASLTGGYGRTLSVDVQDGAPSIGGYERASSIDGYERASSVAGYERASSIGGGYESDTNSTSNLVPFEFENIFKSLRDQQYKDRLLDEISSAVPLHYKEEDGSNIFNEKPPPRFFFGSSSEFHNSRTSLNDPANRSISASNPALLAKVDAAANSSLLLDANKSPSDSRRIQSAFVPYNKHVRNHQKRGGNCRDEDSGVSVNEDAAPGDSSRKKPIARDAACSPIRSYNSSTVPRPNKPGANNKSTAGVGRRHTVGVTSSTSTAARTVSSNNSTAAPAGLSNSKSNSTAISVSAASSTQRKNTGGATTQQYSSHSKKPGNHHITTAKAPVISSVTALTVDNNNNKKTATKVFSQVITHPIDPIQVTAKRQVQQHQQKRDIPSDSSDIGDPELIGVGYDAEAEDS